jgi:hypothetical protein
MFYNIQNNNAPMYLCDLIPPTPKWLWEFALRIVLLLNVKLNSGISVFENSIFSVLSELKVINHFFDHSSSSFKSWSITDNVSKWDKLSLYCQPALYTSSSAYW